MSKVHIVQHRIMSAAFEQAVTISIFNNCAAIDHHDETSIHAGFVTFTSTLETIIIVYKQYTWKLS